MRDEFVLAKSQLLQSNIVHSGVRGRSCSSREAARPASRVYHNSCLEDRIPFVGYEIGRTIVRDILTHQRNCYLGCNFMDTVH